MSHLIDMAGEVYGRLTVLHRAERPANRKQGTYWLCQCSCGEQVIVSRSDLITGKVASCGCFRKDLLSAMCYKHGLSDHRLHNIWRNMKSRCYYKKNRSYPNYGGRGVRMCDEWKRDFMNFYNWAMSHGYKDDLTIERVDVDGDYCPENCTWIPLVDQAHNKTNTQYVLVGSKRVPLCTLETDLSRRTIKSRKRLGWSDEDAVNTPVDHPHVEVMVTAHGETHNLSEWSRITGLSLSTLHYRKKAGWPDEKIVSVKPDTHNRLDDTDDNMLKILSKMSKTEEVPGIIGSKE